MQRNKIRISVSRDGNKGLFHSPATWQGLMIRSWCPEDSLPPGPMWVIGGSRSACRIRRAPVVNPAPLPFSPCGAVHGAPNGFPPPCPCRPSKPSSSPSSTCFPFFLNHFHPALPRTNATPRHTWIVFQVMTSDINKGMPLS